MISEKVGEMALGSIPWVIVASAIGTFFYGSFLFVAIARAIVCKEGRVISIIAALIGLYLTIGCASLLF